ncbi:hypothetical protein DHEL01_v211172 [Diaporthe helianthi]|uniref:Uncharacterized protein n=1 Tax=Diaporthe helianthi TaxID=158607 RepID=A0A2P5HJJ3_DIAHE|nr:hypothetical protein DHEL01_v211172 [Diaporthe helianthi]
MAAMNQPGQTEPDDATDASSNHDSSSVHNSSSVRDSDGEITESDEHVYRTTLEDRVAIWRFQLQREHLTPLLRKEMESAIELVTTTTQEPWFSKDAHLVMRLEGLHDDINKHWSKVFKSPTNHSVLLVNINQWETFLVGTLYEDYMLKPHAVNPWEPFLPPNNWLSDLSSQVEHHGQPKDDRTSENQEYHHESIIFPLHEMNLASLVSHAENRLCVAAAVREAGAKGTGGYVSYLIRRCEWKLLAETLINDRQLLNTLCSHKTMHVRPEWLESHHPEMLAQMDDVQRTYFTNISSPTNFTISKHAMDLLARHIASGTQGVHLSRIPKSQIHTSPVSKIKRRLQLFADGLNSRFRRDAAASSADHEEKNHLLFQSQKSAATSSVISDEKESMVD